LGAIAALFKGKAPSLEKRLSKALACHVQLVFSEHNENRRIFITPSDKGGIKIQLDALFQDIDDEHFENLVEFVKNGSETHKQRLIDYLISARIRHPLPIEKHPLQTCVDELVASHFPQLPPIDMVWGKVGKKAQQKSIRLASFWPSKMEIRIHPYVCDDRVPYFYQRFLIFHELCHAWLMVSGQAKSGEHHGPDFYKLEDQCPDVDKARLWEKEQLSEYLATVQLEQTSH
jgi:predicted SprT family Zn-dependent metalloprotease